MEIAYPSVNRMIEYNVLAISVIKVKKADQAKILSRGKLEIILEEVIQLDGDLYDKAVFLLKTLIQAHAFASGNRRTAFIVMKDFLIQNGLRCNVPDLPEQARVMTGIREGYYSDQEIKEWLQHGKIKEFKRF